MTANFSHERSTAPFPIRRGSILATHEVEAAEVPLYMAVLAYKRACARAPKGMTPPTLQEIQARGGFDPVEFADLLAGGDGLGEAFFAVHVFGHSPLRAPLSMVKLNGVAKHVAPDLTSALAGASPVLKSAAPFPILGASVSDGTGVAPSFVPTYLASIAFRQLDRAVRERGQSLKCTLDQVELRGGFGPIAFFDLIAGGDGQGLAWMQTTAKDKAYLAEKAGIASP